MKAPGLDFGGSGNDFFEIFNSFCDVFSKYCLQGSLQHALHETLESLSHLLFEEAENLLRTCRVAGHLPANFQPAYPHYVGPRSAKWVGGGGPPPGGSSIKSAASAEGGRWACEIVTDSCRTPFLALPKPCRHDTDPPLKNHPSSLVGHFFRFLLLSSRAPKITSKNHRQKCENQGFWPPKTPPKLSQNPSKIDAPKNMQFFIDFCAMLLVFLMFNFLKIMIFL